MDNKETYEQVSKHYSAASQGKSEKYGAAVAKSFGYSEEELAAIPEGSNLGLSCGNPLAISSIREVSPIDIGSSGAICLWAHNSAYQINVRARRSLTWEAAPASMYFSPPAESVRRAVSSASI